MRRLQGSVLVVLAACSGARPPAEATRTADDDRPRPASPESGPALASDAAAAPGRAECRRDRDAIMARVEASERRSCATDVDCRSITSPIHPSAEFDVVVHVLDAEALSEFAIAHLDRCGAHHHEASDAVRIVEARCIEQHCGAHVTTLHIDPL